MMMTTMMMMMICVVQVCSDCSSDEVAFVVQHRSHEEDHLWHLGRISASVGTAAARDGESINQSIPTFRVANAKVVMTTAR